MSDQKLPISKRIPLGISPQISKSRLKETLIERIDSTSKINTVKVLKNSTRKKRRASPQLSEQCDDQNPNTSDGSNSEKSGDEEATEHAANCEETSIDTSTTSTGRKRRKKRRIRLTDHVQRAKRKADKREKAIPKLESEIAENQDDKLIVDKEIKENEEKTAEKEPLPLTEYSPFQLLCDNILRKLISKDPEEFFLKPVDEDAAPDYYKLIKIPMDFSSIHKKIDSNSYENLGEFRHDTNLIVENAMSYNEPDTIYYLAAQKLSALLNYFFSEKYITFLYYTLPFAKEINEKQLGIEIEKLFSNETTSKQIQSNSLKIAEDVNAKELLQLSSTKVRLTEKLPDCHLAYLDNVDGAIALNILTEPREKSLLSLGDLIKPIKKGNPGIMQPYEPRICNDYLVSYIDPGPFASFAPQFDSTWATLNKRDSDLLLSCYQSKDNVSDVFSLRQFVADSGDAVITAIDSMLDIITDGEHSKTMRQIEEKDNDLDKYSELGKEAQQKSNASKAKAKNTRQNKKTNKKEQQVPINLDEQCLIQTGSMIKELKKVQYKRLGVQPSITLTEGLPQPDEYETHLAEKVATDLTKQIINLGAKPKNLISIQPIHNALGMDDEDILHEFFPNL